jgi:hypothetical protein
MKQLKRCLLRPFYAIYWIFHFRHPITFNHWLNKHGFWRLTIWLGNFKVITPKSYDGLVKKYPKSNYIIGIDPVNPLDKGQSMFYWYEKDKEL